MSKLLGVARGTITYKPVAEDPQDIRIKRLLDEIYMKDPCLGSRRLATGIRVIGFTSIGFCISTFLVLAMGLELQFFEQFHDCE